LEIVRNDSRREIYSRGGAWPQQLVVVRATGVEDSRRFLRELDEAPGGNNLHYILQCLRVPASVTRV